MKRFHSRIDLSLVVLLLASALGALLLLIAEFNAVSPAEFSFSLGLIALTSGFVIWTFLSTYYDIDGNTLSIHCGPLSWLIPISEIESVKPSRSLISGPALSLQRLELTYQGGKKIRISPKQQTEFLAALGR